VVVSTHPIQYHAPVYRQVQERFGIPVTAVYASDFSVSGYRDPEFSAFFAWDKDLLSGYSSVFLSRTEDGGARHAAEARAAGIGSVLRRLDPAAVLLLGYSPRFHRRAFAAARRGRYPLLFRGETLDGASVRSAKGRLRDVFLRWYYRRFSRLLYIGRRSRDHYRRLGCPEDRLVFSPYCVDAVSLQAGEDDRERLRVSTRRRLGIDQAARVLIFSGKLVPRKAPELLLDALAALPAELRSRLGVIFMGDGSRRADLERSARTHSDVPIRFVGFQNQSALSAYYHAADALVLPSPFEPWGLVVNEALHHGLPCVVSRGVGCGDDLVEAGITGENFAAGSPRALAEALGRVEPLLGSIATREHCRSRVDGYSVAAAAQGIADAFHGARADRDGMREPR
jgi:glycosyltransferase involved in cell wall biosynthesis